MRHEETFFKQRHQINLIVLLLTNNSSGSFTKDLEKEIVGWYRHVLLVRLGKLFPRKMVFIFLTQKNEITVLVYIQIWKRKFYKSIYGYKMLIENYDMKTCCKNNQTWNCESLLLIFYDIFFIGLLNWCSVSWYIWKLKFSSFFFSITDFSVRSTKFENTSRDFVSFIGLADQVFLISEKTNIVKIISTFRFWLLRSFPLVEIDCC